MTQLDDKLEAMEKALKDDRARRDALEQDVEHAEDEIDPPQGKPDHARDGGVI